MTTPGYGRARVVSESVETKSTDRDSKIVEMLSKLHGLMVERPLTFVADKSKISWDKYCVYVENNKKALRTLEDTIRMFSFFMPGRFSNDIVGELIYGTTFVFGTINDRACDDLREATLYVGHETLFVKNFKTIVSIVQHLQVFVELLAAKHCKNIKDKWKIIFYIETFKMVARLYLLYYFNGHMLIVPNDTEMKHQASLQV